MQNHPLILNLEDALFLIGLHKRTGELIIEGGNNIGSLLFHDGRILLAFSPYSRAIGDLLVEGGLISEGELIETLKVQKRSAYAPVGALLHRMGRVDYDTIESLVCRQIREAVAEFRSWRNVSYSFVDKEIAPLDRIHLTVNEFLDTPAFASAAALLAQGRQAELQDLPLPSDNAVMPQSPS